MNKKNLEGVETETDRDSSKGVETETESLATHCVNTLQKSTQGNAKSVSIVSAIPLSLYFFQSGLFDISPVQRMQILHG